MNFNDDPCFGGSAQSSAIMRPKGIDSALNFDSKKDFVGHGQPRSEVTEATEVASIPYF